MNPVLPVGADRFHADLQIWQTHLPRARRL